jgi:hypothetical protein
MTQGKTLLGRAEIAKEWGICDGRKIWKRWVSASLEDSLAASGWLWHLVLPVYERRWATMFFSPFRCCGAVVTAEDNRSIPKHRLDALFNG